MSALIHSSVTGALDPRDPAPLPGWIARTVAAPPVEIAAPRSRVWAVLTELEAYPEWCPFTRRVELSTPWELGADVHLHLCWDAAALGEPTRVQVERLSVYEPERALGWCLRLAGGALRTERMQYLEPREGGTRYYTHDRFAGPLTPLVLALYGAKIAAGFTAVGRALKRRVEMS
ncbi:MAG: SRPBCC domain-containing protein [Myxococcales bacterium]|nr:SRPBCC domain-containing protein [Myxococcales bacterium]